MEACSGGTMTSRNKIMFFTHKEHNRKGCFFITFLLYTPRCTLKRTMLLFFYCLWNYYVWRPSKKLITPDIAKKSFSKGRNFGLA